jgi:hypothetical protein
MARGNGLAEEVAATGWEQRTRCLDRMRGGQRRSPRQGTGRVLVSVRRGLPLPVPRPCRELRLLLLRCGTSYEEQPGNSRGRSDKRPRRQEEVAGSRRPRGGWNKAGSARRGTPQAQSRAKMQPPANKGVGEKKCRNAVVRLRQAGVPICWGNFHKSHYSGGLWLAPQGARLEAGRGFTAKTCQNGPAAIVPACTQMGSLREVRRARHVVGATVTAPG